jgi:hypothetical protein
MTTYEKLKRKVRGEGRMPSIKEIHKCLEACKISHSFRKSTNVVEYRSKGCRYVNSRHDGKEGYKIEIRHGNGFLSMDTSDSYYSWNSEDYARHLVGLLRPYIETETNTEG